MHKYVVDYLNYYIGWAANGGLPFELAKESLVQCIEGKVKHWEAMLARAKAITENEILKQAGFDEMTEGS